VHRKSAPSWVTHRGGSARDRAPGIGSVVQHGADSGAQGDSRDVNAVVERAQSRGVN
jgi:hypothetical protein